MKKSIKLILIFMFGILISSCVSNKIEKQYNFEDYFENVYIDFVKDFVSYDSARLLGNDISIEKIKKDINELEKVLFSNQFEKNQEAKLRILLGKYYLLIADNKSAKKNYDQVLKLNSWDYELKVLERRLGLIKNFNSYLSSYDSNDIYYLEAAIEAFENSDFNLSLALFDKAFLNLDSIYKNDYYKVRKLAYEKSFTVGKKISINKDKIISIEEMLILTRDNFKGSEDIKIGNYKLSEMKLKNIDSFIKSELFYKQSDLTGNLLDLEITLETKVTKKYCARFLWNLYCLNSNKVFDMNKYSKIYRKNSNIKNPIKDVENSCCDFDAILYCVSNEIIPLRDGINFSPEQEITCEEFLSYLDSI